MRYLLNVAYAAAIAVASPWLLHAALRKGKYREGWLSKLWGSVPVGPKASPRVWLHAVSVGEVNVLRPLLAKIGAEHPDWQCVVSTTTKTGYDLARRLFPELPVFYCPLDFSWAVSRAMRRVSPDLLVLVELELWPNLIAAAKAVGAQVVVVNGRLSEKSARGYGRIAWLVRRVLRQVDLVLAQNDEYASRFRNLAGTSPDQQRTCTTRISVTGSLKFDGAQTERGQETTRRLAALAGIDQSDVVFLAGSSQQPEESLALKCFRALSSSHPELRLVLVPRHPERFAAVAEMLDRSGFAWQRRSRLPTDGANPDARILLVDTVGELGAWWGAAHIGFVGGSMGSRGGQNMIEPAACGVATSFGPNTKNFRDVVGMLLAREAAVVVHDAEQMRAFVARCLADPSYRCSLGERARQLVGEQLGATERTMRALETLIASPTRLMHPQKTQAA